MVVVYGSGVNIVGRTFIYWGKEECIVGDNIWVIKHEQNSNYLFHVLSSPHIQSQIKLASQRKYIVHRGMGLIKLEDLKSIYIPVPSLDKQEKIAKHFDDLFVNGLHLKDSLEQMLEIRKKQYEYYKEQILTSEIDKWDR